MHTRSWLQPATGLVAVALLSAAAACGSVAPSPPSGQTAVSSSGVQVFVPASWPRNQLRCGTPVRDTVVVDPGPVEDCLLTPAPPVSYAELRPVYSVAADPDAQLATRPVSIGSGIPARRGEDRMGDGRTRVVLVVPSRKVVVLAVSSDPALARRIVDSTAVT
jgi:hypothetical protein